LLATASVEEAVLDVAPLALPVLAKPLVLPVWLNEVLDAVDGDEALAVLDVAWLLASLLATALVEPVELRELLESDEGEVAAVLLDAAD